MRTDKKRNIIMIYLLMTISLTFLVAARAEIPPYGYSRPNEILARTNQKLAMNSGPGTTRYFKSLGTYGKAGETVRVLARAWDPNNGIWWLKVEYPIGSAFVGWTGLKRFDANSFNLDSVPVEYWYPY